MGITEYGLFLSGTTQGRTASEFARNGVEVPPPPRPRALFDVTQSVSLRGVRQYISNLAWREVSVAQRSVAVSQSVKVR